MVRFNMRRLKWDYWDFKRPFTFHLGLSCTFKFNGCELLHSYYDFPFTFGLKTERLYDLFEMMNVHLRRDFTDETIALELLGNQEPIDEEDENESGVH